MSDDAEKAIADLVRTVELADMVAYAGATWDWHRLHYDRDWVAAAGLTAPVVDGQALGALMAEHVLDHFGPRARLTALSVRYSAPVLAGETVRVSGTASRGRDGEVTVAQEVRVGERRCAHGRSVVRVGDG